MTAEPEFTPAPGRVDPPYVAPEREMLEAWLEFHRATLWTKCAGLSAEQVATRSVEPSILSLHGLVRHMAEVERAWFRRRMAGEEATRIFCSEACPEGDLDFDSDAVWDDDLATWRAEMAAARDVAASHSSLDDLAVQPRFGHDLSLRWIYVHMIEEYARHNGHADFLRERIDGATGD